VLFESLSVVFIDNYRWRFNCCFDFYLKEMSEEELLPQNKPKRVPWYKKLGRGVCYFFAGVVLIPLLALSACALPLYLLQCGIEKTVQYLFSDK
jgi:hypothetical protein